MRAWYCVLTMVLAAVALACTSCRREQKPALPPAAAPSASPVAALSTPSPVDPKVTAAVGKMHQAERAWLAKAPEAAAALKRLQEAQAAYQGKIGPFGVYTGPVRDREARMQELMAARETGDAGKVKQAEKAFQDANAAVDKAEASLRLGNPPIQKAYEEWLAARKAYAALRMSDDAFSKATEELTQLNSKQPPLNERPNADVKEN